MIMSKRISMQLGVLALGVLVLAGCARERNEIKALFVGEPVVAPTRVPIVYRGPIYCYDTIADPSCYAQPFPRPEERFIGALISNGDFPGTDDNGQQGGNSIPAN